MRLTAYRRWRNTAGGTGGGKKKGWRKRWGRAIETSEETSRKGCRKKKTDSNPARLRERERKRVRGSRKTVKRVNYVSWEFAFTTEIPQVQHGKQGEGLFRASLLFVMPASIWGQSAGFAVSTLTCEVEGEEDEEEEGEEEEQNLSGGEQKPCCTSVPSLVFWPLSLFNLNPFERLYWQDKITLTLPRLKCISPTFWLDGRRK